MSHRRSGVLVKAGFFVQRHPNLDIVVYTTGGQYCNVKRARNFERTDLAEAIFPVRGSGAGFRKKPSNVTQV